MTLSHAHAPAALRGMEAITVAYADPPYIGQAARHYDCAEVDHRVLIRRLCDEYPDGWALSLSSPSLGFVLSLCPPDVRVGAWVKTFAAYKPNVNPGYAWEPVIWRGGRRYTRYDETVADWIACPITLKRGLAGAKPDTFCFWVFRLLGLHAGDMLVDLFPGTGAVTRAWEKYQRQMPALQRRRLEADAPLGFQEI